MNVREQRRQRRKDLPPKGFKDSALGLLKAPYDAANDLFSGVFPGAVGMPTQSREQRLAAWKRGREARARIRNEAFQAHVDSIRRKQLLDPRFDPRFDPSNVFDPPPYTPGLDIQNNLQQQEQPAPKPMASVQLPKTNPSYFVDPYRPNEPEKRR